ncbi:MAG: tol-pal system protein YbgF [Candidatus Binatia bacterium]
MSRPSLPALFCVLPLVSLAGCSAQMGGGSDRRYDDLRSLVLEQRRAIEDLRREQESVRAAIDQLQYGRRPTGRPVYGPTGGAAATTDESYWQRNVPPTGAVPVVVSPDGAIPSMAPTPAPVAAVTPTPSPTSEPEKTAVPPELVGSTYDSAVRQLSGGDHDEAIQSFRNYLHENGASPYADDAQFWIGESYFRKGQYHRAIIEFNQVSVKYGSGDRAPSALLRQAEAFRIVGDRVDARLSLQKIINRYPGTGEAAKASKMLTEIGG